MAGPSRAGFRCGTVVRSEDPLAAMASSRPPRTPGAPAGKHYQTTSAELPLPWWDHVCGRGRAGGHQNHTQKKKAVPSRGGTSLSAPPSWLLFLACPGLCSGACPVSCQASTMLSSVLQDLHTTHGCTQSLSRRVLVAITTAHPAPPSLSSSLSRHARGRLGHSHSHSHSHAPFHHQTWSPSGPDDLRSRHSRLCPSPPVLGPSSATSGYPQATASVHD